MVMMFVEGIVLMFDEIIVLFLLYDIYRGGSFSFPTLMGQAVKQSKQNHIRDTRHRIRRWGMGQETLFLDKTQCVELEGGGVPHHPVRHPQTGTKKQWAARMRSDRRCTHQSWWSRQ